VVATEEDEADAADADADADAEVAFEEAAADVEEAEVEADEVAVRSVAFKVPHFSLLVHVAWPSASFGWLLMHCWKVAWQMKKGSVCW
jgi:hypothetical protein